jgi:hypothetical protein
VFPHFRKMRISDLRRSCGIGHASTKTQVQRDEGKAIYKSSLSMCSDLNLVLDDKVKPLHAQHCVRQETLSQKFDAQLGAQSRAKGVQGSAEFDGLMAYS